MGSCNTVFSLHDVTSFKVAFLSDPWGVATHLVNIFLPNFEVAFLSDPWGVATFLAPSRSLFLFFCCIFIWPVGSCNRGYLPMFFQKKSSLHFYLTRGELQHGTKYRGLKNALVAFLSDPWGVATLSKENNTWWELYVAFLSDPWGVATLSILTFSNPYITLHFYLTRGELKFRLITYYGSPL